MICDNLKIKNGNLYFAGLDTVALAKKYGTPLYLMDEDKIRENCKIYTQAFSKYFGDKALALYASKANCFKYLYKIIKEEGMGIDVVSQGEIYTAKAAGFDLSKAFFHCNNKTDEDILFGIENNIGYFVCDNIEEAIIIDKIAKEKNIVQKILLRLTPGIDTHTYEADKTGKVDSKFGTAIETGQAEELVLKVLDLKAIDLRGFHCHVGSQVFEEDVFERTCDIMIKFIYKMKKDHNYMTKELDLGGGYGVRYVESDPILDIDKKIESVANVIKKLCKELNIEVPFIYMEPGRSIVADAGMTLYTVGTIKKIPGYKNYVSIDGGMADAPRYPLYKASYTCLLANKMNEKCDFDVSVVGRCCESGDIIQEQIKLPSSVERYDTLALLTTGAYHYSMASNYNRLGKPATVMIKNKKDFVVINRESNEDMMKNEL